MENLWMHATGLHWLARKPSNGNGGHWSSARVEIAHRQSKVRDRWCVKPKKRTSHCSVDALSVHRPFLVVVRNFVQSLGANLESAPLALRFVPIADRSRCEPDPQLCRRVAVHRDRRTCWIPSPHLRLCRAGRWSRCNVAPRPSHFSKSLPSPFRVEFREWVSDWP